MHSQLEYYGCVRKGVRILSARERRGAPAYGSVWIPPLTPAVGFRWTMQAQRDRALRLKIHRNHFLNQLSQGDSNDPF
jgi:hypothetical protein